jgi:hypothetical protein
MLRAKPPEIVPEPTSNVVRSLDVAANHGRWRVLSASVG